MHVATLEAKTIRAMQVRSRVFLACTAGTLVLAAFLPGYNMLAVVPAALALFIARE